MNAYRTHTGLVAALDRPNVDTDQIIPKQFLKRVERTGFGPFLFYDWRYDAEGKPKSDFILNQAEATKPGASLAHVIRIVRFHLQPTGELGAGRNVCPAC